MFYILAKEQIAPKDETPIIEEVLDEEGGTRTTLYYFNERSKIVVFQPNNLNEPIDIQKEILSSDEFQKILKIYGIKAPQNS